MNCRLCGHEFDEESIGRSCHGCGKKECSAIHCPKCGYANHPEYEQEFKFIISLKNKLKSIFS
ncbi:hypothetical protein MBCUT_08510 [Methanobrevibacter cuticularis]|uniref:Uncharacterized protein n=1 Tax=Methanobrevibacter cuticularis TaxID=47311 RepID=A0A166EB46_9EURY|nr:hypothetical protein [Methanobrevibacter cuticularis]KZX16465.1 hypothetical protein MBCUT_08510 [Methanobrevibacter cuticularis]